MQAIILAAGKGTRLYPLTKNTPKVMIDIAGKPLLEHQITHLKKYGIKNIFINLFTHPQSITEYFGDGKKLGVNIHYAYESALLGTAGALHNFKKKLKNHFFVLYGDVFVKVNLFKMLNFHKKMNSQFTLAVHKAKHPKDSDLVKTNKEGRVLRWLSVPHAKKTGVNSAGLYIINSRILDFLPATVPYDFAKDFIPFLLKKIPVFAYHTSELIMDIGTKDRYNKLLNILKK